MRHTKLPKITRTKSGKYQAKLYDGIINGKAHFTSFTDADYNNLLIRLSAHKADISAETAFTADTLYTYAQMYLNSKANISSPSTMDCLRFYLKTDIPLWQMKASAIKSSDLQIATNTLSAIYAPLVVRNIISFAIRVLSIHFPNRKYSVTYPKGMPSETKVPTEDEIRRILEKAKGTSVYIPILLGACLGMRISEVVGLKWDCVDLKAEVIHIKETIVSTKSGKITKSPKSASSFRTVRLFPAVLNALKAEPRKSPYVVSLSHQYIRTQLHRLQDQLGIDHFRFHDLRHFCVSVMLSLGIPKNYIAAYVGHESEAMIDRVYGHIMATKKTAVEDQLQAYFSAVIK